ncbi:hypothetical protein VMCG_08226 [Cytospora schulzeri]|uniref:Gfo/Idh/MocA-like oxidoreductase N-terminal domain-containing protein n=1 Tax=Cytospora schulzeri TaxID=448051 RepID=A0A423VSX3_9PEZI|nr:hypothetical protein VMCG_08226 [Valsa malicola]
MDEKAYNVSIIGYGLSAKVFHIPFIGLTKGLELHSIVQRSPAEGNSAPADHPSVKHFTTIDTMLEDPEIDLVILTTPPDSHLELTRKILEAGKHVLTEKPFVPTSADADDLMKLAREKNRLLCVYQNRRWDADFLTVQHLLEEDRLGHIYEFETHFDRYRPENPTNWKAAMSMAEAGGVLYDLGSHLIDQIYVLFGMPSGVYGMFIRQREGKFVYGGGSPDQEPDSINAVLSYENRGLIVHVRIGVLSVESKQPRFWIRGTKGSYHKVGLDAQEAQLKSGMKATDVGFGVDGAAYNGTVELLQEDGTVQDFTYPNVEPQTYLKFYELLAKALASGKEQDLPVRLNQLKEVMLMVVGIPVQPAGIVTLVDVVVMVPELVLVEEEEVVKAEVDDFEVELDVLVVKVLEAVVLVVVVVDLVLVTELEDELVDEIQLRS